MTSILYLVCLYWLSEIVLLTKALKGGTQLIEAWFADGAQRARKIIIYRFAAFCILIACVH